jgi:hypothetical protein
MLYLPTALLLALVPQVLAAPAPIEGELPPDPVITPGPTLTDRTPSPVDKRGVTDFIGSIISDLGSAIPSYVASGVPNFFQGFPTGDAVASSLGVSSSDLAALPTQVLNIP